MVVSHSWVRTLVKLQVNGSTHSIRVPINAVHAMSSRIVLYRIIIIIVASSAGRRGFRVCPHVRIRSSHVLVRSPHVQVRVSCLSVTSVRVWSTNIWIRSSDISDVGNRGGSRKGSRGVGSAGRRVRGVLTNRWDGRM